MASSSPEGKVASETGPTSAEIDCARIIPDAKMTQKRKRDEGDSERLPVSRATGANTTRSDTGQDTVPGETIGKSSENQTGNRIDASQVTQAAESGMIILVLPNIQLVERLRHTSAPLPRAEIDLVSTAAIEALAAINPFLRHIVTIKFVRNERKNFLNIRIRKEYIATVSFTAYPQTVVLCTLSMHLEPFIEVHVVRACGGVVRRWSDVDLGGADAQGIRAAIAAVKRRYGLTGEAFRYTADGTGNAPAIDGVFAGVRERMRSGAGSHLAFHLCIRVATKMYAKLLPVLAALPEPRVRAAMAVVQNEHYTAVYRQVTDIEPWLRHFVQPIRAAYPEIRSNYLSSVFAVLDADDGCIYEFHFSDKFEPYIIAVVLDPREGKLVRLTSRHVTHLSRAIAAFKHKFGIANEAYHYTPYAERMVTDAFVHKGGADMKSKAHSTDFHLKIRVSTKMYMDRLQVFSFLRLGELRDRVEPIQYNFSRETMPWAKVLAVLRAEADVYAQEARH
eukprot:m.139563 g.139563  ORF g.139563 m.139563 type:complete len:506 (+) comp17632_c0_seq1:223-1740(+)